MRLFILLNKSRNEYRWWAGEVTPARFTYAWHNTRLTNKKWVMRTLNKAPLVGTAAAAWRDLFLVIDNVALSFAVAVTCLLGLKYMALANWTSNTSPVIPMLLNLILFLGQPLVLTPLAISVHRQLLIGENGLSLAETYRRSLRFYGFVVLLLILCQIPLLILEFGFAQASGFLVALGAVLFLAALGIVVRSILLFPALAVDSPGASWSNALQDTQGHSGRILLILVCTIAPLLIGFTGLSLLLERMPNMPYWEFIALEAQVLGVTITTILIAALASRLYTCYSNHLGRPIVS
jgi:hypothetical protein